MDAFNYPNHLIFQLLKRDGANKKAYKEFRIKLIQKQHKKACSHTAIEAKSELRYGVYDSANRAASL